MCFSDNEKPDLTKKRLISDENVLSHRNVEMELFRTGGKTVSTSGFRLDFAVKRQENAFSHKKDLLPDENGGITTKCRNI